MFYHHPSYSNLIWFLFLYLCGAYVRVSEESESKFGKFATVLNPVNLARLISHLALIVLSMLAITLLVVFAYFATYKFGMEINRDVLWITSQNSIPILHLPLSLIMLFAKAPIPDSRVINAIDSITFGVYLIHDNSLVGEWLWPHFASLYPNGSIMLLVGGLSVSVFVFMCCSAIDSLRILLLENPLISLLRSRFQRFFNWIDQIMMLTPKREDLSHLR